LTNRQLGQTLLPKKLALPIFCSDALSSVAYATEAILVALSAGGLGFCHLAPLLSVAVAVLFVLVAALPADLLRLPQRWAPTSSATRTWATQPG
jgi:hypothetical protein